MTLPMLMGSMPYQLPTLCVDGDTYLLLGFIGGMGFAALIGLIARHILKG